MVELCRIKRHLVTAGENNFHPKIGFLVRNRNYYKVFCRKLKFWAKIIKMLVKKELLSKMEILDKKENLCQKWKFGDTSFRHLSKMRTIGKQ